MTETKKTNKVEANRRERELVRYVKIGASQGLECGTQYTNVFHTGGLLLYPPWPVTNRVGFHFFFYYIINTKYLQFTGFFFFNLLVVRFESIL